MNQRNLTLELLFEAFAVAQLGGGSQVPAWAHNGALASVTRTPTELSIVCAEASVPSDVRAQRSFRCLRIVGPIDFSEIGVLESLARPLAKTGISIFALSTYETDYLLVAALDIERALSALSEAGHVVRRLGAA